jgi:hypothetical protein
MNGMPAQGWRPALPRRAGVRASRGIAAALFLVAGGAYAAAAPLAWKGGTEIAAGRGEHGPWHQNESRYDYVDDPAAAIDGRGDVAVAWVDQGRKDVFFQRIAPDGSKQFAEPVNVSRSPATFSWLPRVVLAPKPNGATNAAQQVFILWQEIIFSGGSHGGDMLFARSQDGGKTFSTPANLSNSIGGDGKGRINKDVWHNGSYDLMADADGTLYAAWTEYDGPLWLSRSVDGGASFSRPQRIAGGGNAKPVRGPSLAAGPGHTLYLAWTTGEDNGADIHVAKSTDGGLSFNAPQAVAPSKGYSDAPKLAVDRAGVLHLVYAESAGGPFDRYQVRYTRSADGARNFDTPREISAPLPPSTESAAFPSLEIDGSGTLYVLWEAYPDHRERPHGLGIAVSQDGGNSFSAPALVPGSADPGGGTNGSHQGLLMKKLAVNGNGAVAIVNSCLRQDRYSRAWLLRATKNAMAN